MLSNFPVRDDKLMLASIVLATLVILSLALSIAYSVGLMDGLRLKLQAPAKEKVDASPTIDATKD